MLWQSAEKAAKFIWPHLKRNNSWQLMVRALDPNIFAIRFYSTEDKEAILFGGAWNLDDYLIVLRDCHPSYPYQQMNFDTSPFWLEFKNLLPEFTYPEILRLFADIVVETIVVELDGVHPTTSTKFRAMIQMNVNSPMLKGMHAANAAGVSR